SAPFKAPASYAETKAMAKGVIGYGNNMGEGWLLTAEMIELAKSGYNNIICAQPFGCLPNHISGRGMVNKIKELVEDANILPIDYDASASKVNQENRIKLMLATAR
ncbi:MAG: 2-hydroxyglutaryl-CoA dehydratase, partial [Phascolarctobacterium sp.]|nr:2-hydroxyglutaryl-CoA dehydratase [Phascolarctobacterium sp.]